MLERQRLTYLECFGIDNYIPRRTLQGAAPSPLLSDELLQGPSAFSTADLSDGVIQSDIGSLSAIAVGSDHTDSGGGSSPSLKSITDMLSGGADNAVSAAVDNHESHQAPIVDTEKTEVLSGGATSSITSSLDTSTASEVKKTLTTGGSSPDKLSASELHFVLNIWRVNDLLIVDSRQPASALPTDRLLQNILSSVGYRVAQLPSSELLRWPLFTSAQFANTSPESDEAEARAMVQAYISAQCLREPTQAVLLFGEEACSFALSPDQPREHLFNKHQGSAIFNDDWKLNAVVAPSLVDMLQEPSKKRITWQALQALLTSATGDHS